MTGPNSQSEELSPLVGPHSESPPARLIEADSPVYLLVGDILDEREAGGGPFQLLVAPGYLRDFDPEFLPMIRFFRIARTEQQANDWLAWAGTPEGALKDLVETGLVLRVDTTNPLTAAASFDGVRIIPNSVPGEVAPDQPTLVSVRRSESTPVQMFVPIELENVLWGLDQPFDLPTAIKHMAKEAAERPELIARRVLTNIPALVRLDLAHLEWVNAPGI